MRKQGQETFQRFGRLDTWIVGIQYYDGASDAVNREVVFDRDPDNPFDPNAIAVYTTAGTQVGHLPRYDAEYFSPLILQGVIALKGLAGESQRGDRLPLSLEIFATSEVSELVARDLRDDWRALYHNIMVDVWDRLPDFTSVTLREFRDRFRPLAHEQPLLPKTQFLYRMLKAHIADLEAQERRRLRVQVMACVQTMDFGPAMGWPELTVIPLDANGDAAGTRPTADGTEAVTALTHAGSRLPDVLRLLPARCPYPAGAHGAVVLVHGSWYSLDWFDSAECAQVYWYPMILAGIESALRVPPPDQPPEASPEAVNGLILEAMQCAECTWAETEEVREGGKRVDITAADRTGYALFQDEQQLIRLTLRESEPEIIYEPNPRSWLDLPDG